MLGMSREVCSMLSDVPNKSTVAGTCSVFLVQDQLQFCERLLGLQGFKGWSVTDQLSVGYQQLRIRHHGAYGHYFEIRRSSHSH
jgi:hypothetical protein